MKHQISKIKVKDGSDANQMLVKKLVRNFIAHGTLETTQTKAKILNAVMQNLVHKALSGTEASVNILLPYLQNRKAVDAFVAEITTRQGTHPASGSVKMLKLGMRPGDAASIVRVVWTHQLPEAKKEVTKEVKKADKVKKTK